MFARGRKRTSIIVCFSIILHLSSPAFACSFLNIPTIVVTAGLVPGWFPLAVRYFTLQSTKIGPHRLAETEGIRLGEEHEDLRNTNLNPSGVEVLEKI
jgi:hypothetical protein